MSDTYKCECGHIVHSSSKEPPESLNWSDGHICILIKEKEKMSKVGEYYRELEEREHEPNNEGEPMEYQTHNDVIIKTSGTSLIGEIKLDYYDILDRLGKPKECDSYKIDAEWDIEFYDGTVATLYNWKNGRNYCGEDGLDLHQIDEWHIGGFNRKALDKVNELFKGEEK